MRVKSLSLQNIGPFIEAEMEFFTDADKKPPVVLITGENATGKSIILDAIRGMFGDYYTNLERELPRRQRTTEPKITLELEAEILEESKKDFRIESQYFQTKNIKLSNNSIRDIPQLVYRGQNSPNWVVDFWPSMPASGPYGVREIKNPQHERFLLASLQGTKSKTDITTTICYFDYMRDSRDPQEQATGEHLYKLLEQIVAMSLLDEGKLSHIARTTLEPIIRQNGQLVSLENLSSGNSYLIQNMVSLLAKMHAVHFLRQTPVEEIGQTPGLLLIDEAENQLHPKWQKQLFRNILNLFPNLQIIATTHSPFIISSIPNARLFVCKSEGDHCVVVDETANYSNKPVDEILMSPLFEETQPFNQEITRLIEARAEAIKTGNHQKQKEIETELKAINPEYFAYFEIDGLLADIAAGGSAQ